MRNDRISSFHPRLHNDHYNTKKIKHHDLSDDGKGQQVYERKYKLHIVDKSKPINKTTVSRNIENNRLGTKPNHYAQLPQFLTS